MEGDNSQVSWDDMKDSKEWRCPICNSSSYTQNSKPCGKSMVTLKDDYCCDNCSIIFKNPKKFNSNIGFTKQSKEYLRAVFYEGYYKVLILPLQAKCEQITEESLKAYRIT